MQIIGGLEGDFAFKDWTWEAYASQGSTSVVNIYNGATSLARWRFVQAQPNYGKGLYYAGNEYGGNFGAGAITCTSGIISVYGVNGWTEGDVPSEDCQKAVTMQPKATGEMKQTVMEYNMQGSVVEMPAGDMRFAAGLSNRVNKYTYFPDPTNTPESVLDSPGAFFPVGEAVGKTEVSEIYGELLVPLLADKPGFQSLNLELGYRTTDNDPSPDDDTYKALIDWTIVDRVRFRGGRQIANRAPNIGELFQASEQFAPFTFVQGDPCSTRDPAQLPYTANAAINGTARANQVIALCSQLMGPAGAAEFYSEPTNQPNTLQVARISNLQGNPNLHSEQAETITAGFVFDLTDRSTLSIDYWRIQITDMIAEEFGDILYENCLDLDTNPNQDPLYPDCTRLVRNPSTGANATISHVVHERAGGRSGRLRRAIQLGPRSGAGLDGADRDGDHRGSHEDAPELGGRLVRLQRVIGAEQHPQRQSVLVRLPAVHDGQLRGRRLERQPTLAVFAEHRERGGRPYARVSGSADE